MQHWICSKCNREFLANEGDKCKCGHVLKNKNTGVQCWRRYYRLAPEYQNQPFEDLVR
jgi:transposase-like protein